MVKKAVYKKTGMNRAIKVLKKANLTEEEQKTIMNEVEILKNLVSNSLFYI